MRVAAKIAEFYGFDLSSVTCTLWKQTARTGRVPLDFGNAEPSAESMPGIREADEIVSAGGGTGESFDSGRALLDAARD